MVARCACGLEDVIRTSWTNRSPGRRFYGCPTLSPTCVNFLRWYDPPMCQRSVQIIPGLLRSRNELEEIVAMVEEKRRKLLKFLIISWVMGYVAECGFVLVDGMNIFGWGTPNNAKGTQQANELFNLMRQRQLLASVNYRRAIIEELECLPGNLVVVSRGSTLSVFRRLFSLR
ncbi:zinc finger, GRF-type containing protein [Tanacetum coccineum]